MNQRDLSVSGLGKLIQKALNLVPEGEILCEVRATNNVGRYGELGTRDVVVYTLDPTRSLEARGAVTVLKPGAQKAYRLVRSGRRNKLLLTEQWS